MKLYPINIYNDADIKWTKNTSQQQATSALVFIYKTTVIPMSMANAHIFLFVAIILAGAPKLNGS